jgi:hypothetical protein
MDNLVFEDSISSEVSQSEFISRKWLYVNDINNGNYTSQIIIDSTPLANAGGYVNWSEGYISMPLVVSLSGVANCGTDANAPLSAHSWAFKSGFWHMINSMSVEFNNQNIVQQTPFLNVFRSFKAMTSFSADDLKQGYSIGFAPDSAGSWAYSTANNSDASQGLSNNRNGHLQTVNILGSNVGNGTADRNVAYVTNHVQSAYGAGAAELGTANPSNVGAGSQYSVNEGFRTRSEWFGYTPSSTTTPKGQQLIMPAANCASVLRAYRLPSASTSVASWSVVAKLRLKDLAEYFEKCPLLKGSTMRFLINTNQTTVNFTVTAATVSATTGILTPGVISGLSVTSQGQTCPLMVASADIGQGSATLLDGTYALSVSIYRDTVNGVQPVTTPVRLYAPVYKMNPIAEQRYLSLAPTKRIEYNDIFSYQFTGISAGSNFNFLVTNGIPNIQSVTVIPFLDAGSTTSNPLTSGTGASTLLSPFTTSGATPDPIALNNFNILISGVNLFLNNQIYDFEQFRQELMSSNQLNGSLTTGLASGLISEDDFSRGMRYYYGNACRALPSEEGVSRSVQILGQNQSLAQISLLVFVEFKKSMTVDIATGARID